MSGRTCKDCRHIWRATCPLQYRKWITGYSSMPACDHTYEPNGPRAVKDLLDAIAAPFIPALNRIEKFLSREPDDHA